jgi:hypothetical protein
MHGIIDQQKRIDDVMAGSSLLQSTVDAQKRVEQLMPDSSALQSATDAQKRIEQLMAGGSMQSILDQQKRIEDLMAGSAFDTYRALAVEAVETIFSEDEADTTDNGLEAESGDIDGWRPTREEARSLLDFTTFVIALLFFTLGATGEAIPAPVERSVDLLLAFAALMWPYTRS